MVYCCSSNAFLMVYFCSRIYHQPLTLLLGWVQLMTAFSVFYLVPHKETGLAILCQLYLLPSNNAETITG